MGLGGEAFRHQPRQLETGHHIGDDHHRVAVAGADAGLAVAAVADRQRRVGMGVVHIAVGQRRVQDGLYRGAGGAGIDELGLELIDHLAVAEPVQSGQLEQMGHAHRGEAGGLDVRQIPSAALDV